MRGTLGHPRFSEQIPKGRYADALDRLRDVLSRNRDPLLELLPQGKPIPPAVINWILSQRLDAGPLKKTDILFERMCNATDEQEAMGWAAEIAFNLEPRQIREIAHRLAVTDEPYMIRALGRVLGDLIILTPTELGTAPFIASQSFLEICIPPEKNRSPNYKFVVLRLEYKISKETRRRLYPDDPLDISRMVERPPTPAKKEGWGRWIWKKLAGLAPWKKKNKEDMGAVTGMPPHETEPITQPTS